MTPKLYFYQCPVTDVIGSIVEAISAAAPEIEAGAGAAAAGAGAADAAGAFAGDAAAGGLDAATTADLTASLGTDAAASAASSAADAGLTAGLGAGADTAGIGGAGSLTSSLPTAEGAAGTTGAAGGTSATLDPLTVTAASTAPGAATGSSALGNLASGVGAGLTGLAAGAGAGGGGSGVSGTQSQPADFSSSSANNELTPGAVADTGATLDTGLGAGSGADSGFLSATGVSDVSQMTPDFMQLAGIEPGPTGADALFQGTADTGVTGGDISGLTAGSTDLSAGAADPSLASFSAGGDSSGGISKWLSNPKNAATAGMLGLSLKNAVSQPKLPGASTTAANAATQGVKSATSVINSGGTATPEWASQKASIDATINQQIQQQTQAIMQAAASSGEGNQNSGIVQQQIAQMTANANTQRQQLYEQAQTQNVNAALSELSGGDSVLTSIGNTQLQQSREAQQLAAQTAALALQLGTSGAGSSAGSLFSAIGGGG